jgi:hypothetical protein
MADADIQTSFAAGELSPQLYARVDLDKFQVGAALLRNFFVDYRGGASNRAGTEYIDTTVQGARLIPFIVSTEAAYVLVFSDLLITIYNSGVLVTTVVTPYLTQDLFTLAYTQSADVLTLVHPNYPPADLSRTSDVTFAYTLITTGPDIDPPVIPAVATSMIAPHSGPYSFGYLITAVDLNGKEESLPSNPGVKHSEGMNELTNRVIGLSWNPPTQGVSRYNVYKWGPIDAVTLNPATVWGFIGSSQTTTFSDNNIAPDFSKQPPGWGDPFSGGQFESIVVNAGGAGYDGVSGDWPTAIPYVPLSITGDGTGASGYAVIDHATGKIVGVYLTNAGKNYTTATVTANGQGGTGATFTYRFTNINALNPAATAYLQQRRVFGGSTLKPETLVMSQPGLITNFNTTPVTLATDALVISIAAEEVNTIRSFVQVNYGLLAFTTGGSFLINGGTPGAAIDANSPSIQPQVSQGANTLRPLRINYDVIYGQAKGNRIHNLAFAWQKQSYAGGDISMLAAHLFDTFMTVDWAYAEEPFKIVWTVRNDGRLLSLTYVPDQEVTAWCRHDTQGAFRSVCTVPEGNVDAVYFIVERHVPNSTGDPCWVYYLERMADRQGCCIYDAWHLDCALSLDKPTNVSPLFITAGVSPAVTLRTYDPCSSVPTGNFGGAASVPSVAGIQNFDLAPMTHRNAQPSIDFDGGRLFVGNAFDSQIASYSFPGYTLLNGPVTSINANNGLAFNEVDGYLYGVGPGGANSASCKRMDSHTFAEVASFGVDNGPFAFATTVNNWAFPRDMDTTVDSSGRNYMVSTALLASQVSGQISVLVLDTMIAWDEQDHHTDEFLGVVCKGNVSGGFGHAWVVTQTNNLGGSISLGLYRLLLTGGSSSMSKIGLIPPSSLGPGWTHSTDCIGILLDEQDGNIIAQYVSQGLSAWSAATSYFSGDLVGSAGHDFVSKSTGNINHVPTIGGDTFWTDLGVSPVLGTFNVDTRIVKINVRTRAVMWSVPIIAGMVGSQLFNQSRCQYGRLNWIDNLGGASAKQHSINTITGVDTVSAVLSIISGASPQFTEDYTGNTFFNTDYVSGGNVAQIGTTPTSFSSWATLGPGPAIPAAAPPTVVGQVIQVGCGKVLITGQATPQQVSGNIIAALDLTVPDDPDGLMFPVDPGDWTITTPVTTVSGLGHLEGKVVYALADGLVEGPFTVAGGSVTLPDAASNIIVGLKFTQQIQTLYLTTQGIQSGSDQGKRKQISGVTVRTDCTAGLKAGTDFDYLTPIPELNENLATGDLFTGDSRVLSFPQWDTPGQTCIQQDDPLPATVLGVIVEVTPGDTGS